VIQAYKEKKEMKFIRKTAIFVMVMFIVFGVGFFVREWITKEWSPDFWQVYIGGFAGVYGVFMACDSWQKNSKNKYYAPERDDEHPGVQEAAIEALKSKIKDLKGK
jgi:uncharacterized membrane protein YcjF (UPF0283 family)